MIQPVYRGGLLIPKHGVWMDPQRPKPFAIISHAHSDHVARHASYLATPQSIDLIRIRMGDAMASRGIPLSYGECYDGPGCAIRLYAAGHVLGSAMVHVQSNTGESLLYTGDFKMRHGLAAEPIEIPQVETLVMETTFGRPEYVFPVLGQAQNRIKRFCSETLAYGQTPVLLAYSLGKAQEVLKILEGQGYQLMAHKTIRGLNQVYESYGISMPETRPFDLLDLKDCVVVMSPVVYRQLLHGQVSLPRDRIRSAMISGWGVNASARYRYRVDEVIPLSDHADYSELLEFVSAANPKRVYTVHGYHQEFAADLRRRGIDAWSLCGHDQLELF